MTATICLVLARADNGVIGNNGALPWRIPDDLKRFKAITMGKPIVMGRKTWDSFPKKPLPGRTNIVITRDAHWHADGAVVAHSLEEALAQARGENPSEIAIIGGAEIYKLALAQAQAQRIYLTEVHQNASGDVYMPAFRETEWHEVARENQQTADGLNFSYVTLERR